MSNERQLVFSERFGEIIAGVLKQLTGKEFQIGRTGSPAGKLLAHIALFRIKSAKEAAFHCACDRETYRALATALLGEAPQDENSADVSEAFQEFWRLVLGRANTDVHVLNGAELEIVPSDSSAEPSAVDTVIELRSDQGTFFIGLACREQFLSSVTETAPPTVESAATVMNPICDHDNLDLLMDIPLSVSLRFGERRMPLREILELSSGAVLELDRQAEEPVDLCLNERVIARGQVVVVDGCYGLRVTQICRPVECELPPGVHA